MVNREKLFRCFIVEGFCMLNWGCLAILDGDFLGESFDDDDSMMLKVANKSKDTICVYLAIDDKRSKSELNKDLLSSSISPGATGYSAPMLYIGNGYVPEMPPSGIIKCYIIHKDTLNKYGLEDVCASNRAEVRYDLTEYDIIRLPHLVFPPDRSMLQVKMEPAYGIYLQK